MDEMIASFDLKNVSRGVSSFNYEKLYWLNQHYQKNDPVEDVAKALSWHFEKEGINPAQGPALTDLVSIQAERCKTLAELCHMSMYFYTESIDYDAAAVKKHLRPVVLEPLTALYERLKTVVAWEKDQLQECINDISAQFDINMGKIAQPLRVAVTGSGMSPSIDMTLMLLGKDKVLSRLAAALEQLKIRSDGNLGSNP